MVEKIKKFIKDFKIIISIVIAIFIAGSAFAGWLKLPKEVKEVKKIATDNSAVIGKVAANLDKYMAVNEEYKAQQMEQKTLMLELIKQK